MSRFLLIRRHVRLQSPTASIATVSLKTHISPADPSSDLCALTNKENKPLLVITDRQNQEFQSNWSTHCRKINSNISELLVHIMQFNFSIEFILLCIQSWQFHLTLFLPVFCKIMRNNNVLQDKRYYNKLSGISRKECFLICQDIRTAFTRGCI